MSLAICLPCGGGFVSEKTTIGLFHLGKILSKNNIEHGLLTISCSSSITHLRSRMANFFVNNTEFDYLFFLDNDISFDANDVIKLMNHNLDIVCGAYPMKILPRKYCINFIEPENRNDDLIELYDNGLGFCLIKRDVFYNISKKYPGLKYIPNDYHTDTPHTNDEIENSYHYFAECKVKNNFMSEDKSFFYRARECGYKVWLDSSIKLGHYGFHNYGD